MRRLKLLAQGEVALGTLNGYVKRHGLAEKAFYLGDHHVAVEHGQAHAAAELVADIMASTDEHYVAIVHLVYDALTTMFEAGANRYYGDILEAC